MDIYHGYIYNSTVLAFSVRAIYSSAAVAIYIFYSTVYSTTQYTSSTFQSLYCSRGKSKKNFSLIFVKYEYINRGTCKSFVAFPPYVYSLLPHIYFNHIGQTALHLDYILQNPFYSKSNFQK